MEWRTEDEMTYETRAVMEPVDASARAVYDFAVQMENLPQWASGLPSGIERRGGKWIARSPMGEVAVAMAERNRFGVLDHDVTLPDGTTVHNAFRVTPAGPGCLLTFIVLRLPGTSEEAFASDVAHVQRDLKVLRALMEEVDHRSGSRTA
jgi:hypothetical protein